MMNNLYKIIGSKIAEKRKALKLSQEKLAEKSNLHPNYIGLIERGQRKVSIETLSKIIYALNSTFKEIFDDI